MHDLQIMYWNCSRSTSGFSNPSLKYLILMYHCCNINTNKEKVMWITVFKDRRKVITENGYIHEDDMYWCEPNHLVFISTCYLQISAHFLLLPPSSQFQNSYSHYFIPFSIYMTTLLPEDGQKLTKMCSGKNKT